MAPKFAALCADPERPVSGRLGAILVRLRARRAALEAQGLRSVSVFGSVARGEDEPSSDLDLLYTLDPARPALDVFDLAGIAATLAEIAGMKVELVSRAALPSRLAPSALRDEVVVF